MSTVTASSKTPLWMRVTLFVSLAINLLILGIAVGFVLFASPDKRADRPPRDVGFILTRALDPEDRRAVRRDFASALMSNDRRPEQILTGLDAVIDELRASPFDAERFSTALAAQSDRRKLREQAGRDALAARIGMMTDAERAAYADRVQQDIAKLTDRLRR